MFYARLPNYLDSLVVDNNNNNNNKNNYKLMSAFIFIYRIHISLMGKLVLDQSNRVGVNSALRSSAAARDELESCVKKVVRISAKKCNSKQCKALLLAII